ncbi:MAG: DUF2206 domain-containing protein, partial [Candidatus Adlerbacteria bacterium]|nr:DUF2206 domain-containing protein [Candidatus Adlerbacteria bacterium]
AALSFLWSSVLTDTSSNSLYRVITETVTAMQDAYAGDTRSGDVLYSLFSWKRVDTEALFAEYKTAAQERVSEEPESYYPQGTVDDYDVVLAKQELLPLTTLGSTLSAVGINVPAFNFTFRQLSAKFLQLFMLIGVIAALYRKKWFAHLPPPDFILMGAGSIFVLCLIIVLPVLSVEYGLLRAFQQSLMLLAPFIVIGSMVTFFFVRKAHQELIAGTLVLIFLLSSTGVFTQLLGGYDAQLHLNNSGPYYDLYYVHESEEAAIDWLAGEVARNVAEGIEITIQSDHYGVQAAPALKGAYIVSDIYPPLIRRDAYVVLSVKNVTKNQATVSYNQTALNYYYPEQFLEDTKSLVYDQDGVRIYR